ncbi:MAG: hypothetical protein R2831_08325 [Chitinophagaceae bacterium]
MKKFSFLIFALLIHASVFSQKANILSASNYLKDNDFANAKKMIDKATADGSSTADNAKAWLMKAIVYEAIAIPSEMMPQLQFLYNDNLFNLDLTQAKELRAATPDAFQTSVQAFSKAMSLDKKYDKNELTSLVTTLIGFQYNEGVTSLNSNKLADAQKSFSMVNQLVNLDNGNLFKGVSQFDTLAANAAMYEGYAALQQDKTKEALPLIEQSMNSPYLSSVDVFAWAMEVYEKEKNEAKFIETVAKAKAKFPNNKKIINNEINYYLSNNKTNELASKLKEGIAADPNNDYLYINLGQVQYNIANPTDAKGNALPKPANAKDLEKEAIANYTKAAEIKPSNPYSQFYLGLVPFNEAKLKTDEMNKADDKKYAAIKPERDALIQKSIPFLEKAKQLIESEGINDSNKEMYNQTLMGLSQSYNILGQTTKAQDMEKLIKK